MRPEHELPKPEDQMSHGEYMASHLRSLRLNFIMKRLDALQEQINAAYTGLSLNDLHAAHFSLETHVERHLNECLTLIQGELFNESLAKHRDRLASRDAESGEVIA